MKKMKMINKIVYYSDVGRVKLFNIIISVVVILLKIIFSPYLLKRKIEEDIDDYKNKLIKIREENKILFGENKN
jgi:flagellar assembly factor FliW